MSNTPAIAHTLLGMPVRHMKDRVCFKIKILFTVLTCGERSLGLCLQLRPWGGGEEKEGEHSPSPPPPQASAAGSCWTPATPAGAEPLLG